MIDSWSFFRQFPSLYPNDITEKQAETKQLAMNGTESIPVLAFGLYKVPISEEGERIVNDAIQAGYRHFDTASLYGNEKILGEAIRKSRIPRNDFFICSKVWNDAQKEGRPAVRASIEKSLSEFGFESMDVAYIHWPVPGHFVETYKELQLLYQEGKIRNIGISNFGIVEYEKLVNSDSISVHPIINQIEVSPFMYRPATINYFQERKILVAASKALHRASGIDEGVVKNIADKNDVTPAQVMIRWSLQKRLIVIIKTSQKQRMTENRNTTTFSLTNEEMKALDSLTSEKDIADREALEIQRRNGV
jgi:diketogulonate reductase-like aldo/keto reductase